MKTTIPYIAGLATILLLHCNTPNNDGMTTAEKRERVDAMYAEYKSEFPDVADVSPAEVESLRETRGAVLVDVRTPEERAVSMIPGAITEEEFAAQKEQLKDRPVIAHCTIGYRSGLFAKELAAEGYDARNLAGSILAWVHAGYPVIDPETGEPTARVHTYGPEWDLLPEDAEAVW